MRPESSSAQGLWCHGFVRNCAAIEQLLQGHVVVEYFTADDAGLNEFEKPIHKHFRSNRRALCRKRPNSRWAMPSGHMDSRDVLVLGGVPIPQY